MWAWHSACSTCFVISSSDFEGFQGLNYKQTVQDVGELSRFFTGWGRNELFGLTVRERRHWVNWASEMIERDRKAREEWQQQLRPS
jgi:hypothetical protein